MQAATFQALGEPSRLRIVELLRDGPRPVGEIADALGIRQPQVSKHLRVLTEAGLAVGEQVARHRIYRLEPEPFEAIVGWVESFEQLWETRLDSLGDFLAALASESDTRAGATGAQFGTTRPEETGDAPRTDR